MESADPDVDRGQVAFCALKNNPAQRGPAALAALSDDELVIAARGHNDDAFEALMRRYNRRLFRTCRSILRDEAAAEDAVQECYVRAFTHLHRYQPGTFSGWLTRVAINEALMLRRRGRRQTLSLEDAEKLCGGAYDPELLSTPDTSTAASARQLLEQAIDSLPMPFRIVFVLRAVEQLSTAETAACLQINRATVKTRLHRAQARLREDISRRLRREHLTLFEFGGARCDHIVVAVLGRLRGESSTAALEFLL